MRARFLTSGTSSPVDSLPIELLSLIFVLATEGSPDATDNVVPFTSESVKTPLVLSAVSRRWRAVAHSTSSLWTRLCATVGSITVDKGNHAGKTSFKTSHITSYLLLSRRYPIDILIDARDQHWDFSEPE